MIHCRVVTPTGIYKEFDTPILNLDTEDGERGILPNHMPIVTMLKIGMLDSIENDVRTYYAVAGGLFYFRDNQAEIITPAIEQREEIDAARAERAKMRAEKRLSSDNPNIDQKRAEVALKRALNRLHVSEYK
ncbi:MAG: ATP synthase F1 subunit epsilon [Solobacterium sp.]|nr:ATP synthase F1 subunit epsilon [Solobacterium sp.]